jgi:plastocyanin
VVYIADPPKGFRMGIGAPKRIEQRNLRFEPDAVVVPVGTLVDFPNLDDVYHNVFSTTPGNEFDLGPYRSGASKQVQIKQAGEVEVYCDIHPDMKAKVLAVPSRFYAEVDGNGVFDISGIPVGRYTLVAWSPVHEPERRTIEIRANAKTSADFTLRPRVARPHLNKSGEPYGRVK